METTEDEAGIGYGEMLKVFRERAGFRQRALAERLGCTDGFIAYIENERRQPSDEFLLRFAEEMKLTSHEKAQLIEAVGRGRLAANEQRLQARLASTRKLLQVDTPAETSSEEPTRPTAEASAISEELLRALQEDAELREVVEALRGNPALKTSLLNKLRNLLN
jgi:transcriptional regulator with XRE-family HTH domain